MIRRPPRSTLFPYTDALPISRLPGRGRLAGGGREDVRRKQLPEDRKSTRLNSSHSQISYAVFCLKKKQQARTTPRRSDSTLRDIRQRHNGLPIVRRTHLHSTR